MPGQHAVLSPSASERWISCPASIRMEQEMKVLGVEDEDSVYAREGTAAHALGELKARALIMDGLSGVPTALYEEWLAEFDDILSLDDVDLDDMHEHTDAYVALIRERMALYPMSQLMLEERLNTGVPTCWGTSDTVIVSPFHVEIIDFKYGSGVYVSVAGNPQTRLYASGALDTYGELLGDIEVVRITIHQPRMNNIQTEELTPVELREWRDSIIPVAESALNDPDAPFGPSEDACRWCPASGHCRAEMEDIFSTDFDAEPDTLSPEQIADILPRVPQIKHWLASFEEAALTTAYAHGTPIPGYKVVLSGGIRKVTDPKEATKILTEAGYTPEQFCKPVKEAEVQGIGNLEKLLKKDFKRLLVDTGIVRKTEGRPSLVPEEDDRPTTSPTTEAEKDFS